MADNEHWWNRGPLSGDSHAAQGARMGAAAGPGGMAAGYVFGKMQDWLDSRALRAMGGTTSRNNASFSERQVSRTNWDLQGDSPLAQFGNFGHGSPADIPDGGNIGTELGITDWNQPDTSEDDKPQHESLKESRENDSRAFALQGVSNFLVGGQPVINGSRGYGAFGGSGQGYFQGRKPGK